MVDVYDDGEGSGPGSRARVRISCSVMGAWRIALWLGLEPNSDMRESVNLSFRFMVKHG